MPLMGAALPFLLAGFSAAAHLRNNQQCDEQYEPDGQCKKRRVVNELPETLRDSLAVGKPNYERQKERAECDHNDRDRRVSENALKQRRLAGFIGTHPAKFSGETPDPPWEHAFAQPEPRWAARLYGVCAASS